LTTTLLPDDGGSVSGKPQQALPYQHITSVARGGMRHVTGSIWNKAQSVNSWKKPRRAVMTDAGQRRDQLRAMACKQARRKRWTSDNVSWVTGM